MERDQKVGVGFLSTVGRGEKYRAGLKEAGGATNRGKRTRDV